MYAIAFIVQLAISAESRLSNRGSNIAAGVSWNDTGCPVAKEEQFLGKLRSFFSSVLVYSTRLRTQPDRTSCTSSTNHPNRASSVTTRNNTTNNHRHRNWCTGNRAGTNIFDSINILVKKRVPKISTLVTDSLFWDVTSLAAFFERIKYKTYRPLYTTRHTVHSVRNIHKKIFMLLFVIFYWFKKE